MKLDPFRTRRDRELDDEIQAHLRLAIADRIARGESPRDAERNARAEFGNELLIKEVTRTMWGWNFVERIGQDLRYASRALVRAPGFSAAVILCLALGIGANTATFSLADAMLLRPLPIGSPSQVVNITSNSPEIPSQGLSFPDLTDLRQRTRSYSGLVGHRLVRLGVARPGDPVPRMKMGMYVTQDFFQTLQVSPLIGRPFTPEESSVPGRGPHLILSYDFWRTELGRDPQCLGRSLLLNGQPYTIIGVAPEDFTVHQNLRPAFYLPLTSSPSFSSVGDAGPLERRQQRDLVVRARLRPGASLAQANSELAALSVALQRQYPDTNHNLNLRARDELSQRIQDAPAAAGMSALLLALSLLVLIIACANAANLVLARSRARAREMAIRLAIGAGRTRLVQQLLTESLVLSIVAAAAGVALALTVIRYLAAIQIPTDTPIVIATRLDLRVLLFALAVAVVSALLAGLAPAWRSAREDLAQSIKTGDSASSGSSRLWGRNLLVAGQVSLAVVLLVISAALLDAFRRMSFLDPGIRTDRVMMMEFDPALARYTDGQTKVFYQQLIDRVRSLSGVRAATLARTIPFRPNFSQEAIVPEDYQLPQGQRSVTVASNVVDEAYFATMGVAMLRGRTFVSADTEATRRVAIVNQEFSRRFCNTEDPIGRRFRLGESGPLIEIVGLARNAKYLTLAESPQPFFYLPLSQNPRSTMTLLVQTEAEPAAIAAPLFEIVRSLDPNQPVYNVRDFQTYYERGVLGTVLVAVQMAGATGAVGLGLALVGLYGLISYAVSLRFREIGIRMAIGASRPQVLKLVLTQGLRLTLSGAVIGMALSFPLFRLLAAQLAGLGNLTHWTLAIAPATMLLIATAACYLPARRASRIDPLQALRLE
jgi:putative ABC transport system permease protein